MTKEKQEEKTETKPEYEEKQPTLSRNITMSKDKNWLIIRTVRTDLFHVNYMDKVMGK